MRACRHATKGLGLAKVERRVVADGDQFCIQCAVRSDLSSPTSDFLDELSTGAWAVKQDESLDSHEAQVDAYDIFLAAMEYLAERGDLPKGMVFNVLRDGIWEFKQGSIRVTYYDTDGLGGHVPKRSERSLVMGTVQWPDDYDEYLRLTTAFEKTTQKTTEGQLYLADKVREEDLSHDRQEHDA